MMGSR